MRQDNISNYISESFHDQCNIFVPVYLTMCKAKLTKNYI